MKRFVSLLMALSALRPASTPAWEHTFVFTAPPRNVPTRGMPDGPLLGNGDVGVVLGGPPEAQSFYIGKNDFWTTFRGNPRARTQSKVIHAGRIELSIPALRGASYRQEQDLALAEVRGVFARDAVTVRTRSWVQATGNLLFTEIEGEGSPVRVSVRHFAGGLGAPVPAAVQDNARPAAIGRELHGGGGGVLTARSRTWW